jgi:hypothetical protein
MDPAVDLKICEPMANGFRFSEGLPLFKGRIVTTPDRRRPKRKERICDNRFTLADILLFCFLDFGRQFGQPLREENRNVVAWFARVKVRPPQEFKGRAPRQVTTPSLRPSVKNIFVVKS